MDAMQCKCYLFVILCGECFVLVYLKEMDVFVVGAIIWDHHRVTDLDEDLCLCILCVDDLSINVHISVSLVAASWAEVVYRTRVVLTAVIL